MKTPDLFPLMDACTTSGEHLSGLFEAMAYSHAKLSDEALSACISLGRCLLREDVNSKAKLNEAVHQLLVINSAVNRK